MACSKCPFHYVVTPFTFHKNRDELILQTVAEMSGHRQVSTGTLMCQKHERRNSSQLHTPEADGCEQDKNGV